MNLTVLLRIDVDNPYGLESFISRKLNYFSIQFFPISIKALGYLKHLDLLLRDLDSRGIRSTFFFQFCTLPTNLEDFSKHEIGFHAVRTPNYEVFKKDLDSFSRKIKRQILGFTKHGSGKRKMSWRHTVSYEPLKYLKWAKKAGLKYFIGNGEDPREEKTFVNSILYFPSVFWIEKEYRKDEFTVKWLIEESKKRDIVVLIHEDVMINESTRKDFELILSNVQVFKTISEIL